MEKEFLNFVANILEVNSDSISLETSYDDGAWSSLMHIRLVAEISAEYGVDIPIDEVGNIHTLADFYRYVKK